MKDDIDKIDEQIQSIKNVDKKEKKSKNKTEKVPTEEIEKGDTIKIDNLKEVESVEEAVEEETEDEVEEETKKVETVSEEVPEKEVDKVVDEELDNTFFSDVKKGDIKGGNTVLYILIGLIVLLLLAIGVFLLKDKIGNKEETAKKEKVDYEQVLRKYGDALKGIVAVYYSQKNQKLEYEDAIELIDFDYDVVCATHFIYDDGTIFLDDCTVDGNVVDSFYGEKKKEEKVIPAGNVKIYVSKETGVATFDEPTDVNDYDIYGIDIENKYQELSFLNAKSSDYIYYVEETKEKNIDGYEYSVYNARIVNYKTGESALKGFNTVSMIPIKTGNKFDEKYVAASVYDQNKQEVWGFYDIINNKKVVDTQYNEVAPYLYLGVSGPTMVAVTPVEDKMTVVYWDTDKNGYSVPGSYRYGVVDYTDGKYSVPMDCTYMLRSGDYLWCKVSDEKGYIYDYLGNKYLDSKYDKLYGIVDGKFVLVQDKDHIKMVSNKGVELYDYGEYSYDSADYFLAYDKGAIFTFNSSTPDDPGDPTQENCIEFIYYGNTGKGEVKNTYCGGIAKPILYLYPEKETNVTVTFEHPEFLETTYPKFTNSWNVKASPNGDLYDKNGKYYYALYWDEKKVHTVDFTEGFYVEGKNAIDFLEEKLTIIGLNAKERNEFIMYWLPILEKNKKSLVYFELTEERENVNKINISPKPDSLLRVVIHVKKVDKKVNIKEEKLTGFNRTGFVAVEWGGTTY